MSPEMAADDEVTVEDLLAEIQPRTAVARVLLRQDLAAEHARLDAQLRAALERDQSVGGGLDSEAPALARQVLDFEAEIEESRRSFTFRAVGRRRWQNLLGLHPPTKDQRAARPGIDFNPETFPPAAIQMSCVSPVMDLGQVQQLADAMTVEQFDLLWAACLDANVGGSVPKSLVAGGIARASVALGISPS